MCRPWPKLPDRQSLALPVPQNPFPRPGQFTSWICLGCGYTEFYAGNLDGIEALAASHPDKIRIIDAAPESQGAYR